MGIKNAAAWRRLPMPRLILDTAKIGNYLTRQGGCAKFPWIFLHKKAHHFRGVTKMMGLWVRRKPGRRLLS